MFILHNRNIFKNCQYCLKMSLEVMQSVVIAKRRGILFCKTIRGLEIWISFRSDDIQMSS